MAGAVVIVREALLLSPGEVCWGARRSRRTSTAHTASFPLSFLLAAAHGLNSTDVL